MQQAALVFDLDGTIVDRKPDPRHLLTALEQLRAPPNESVMIGDNENDHAAARAAGVAVIVMRYGYLRVPAGNAGVGCVARSVWRHPASAPRVQSKEVARIMRRELLGFQHEQKRRHAEQLFTRARCDPRVRAPVRGRSAGKRRRAFKKHLSPIETELLAAA